MLNGSLAGFATETTIGIQTRYDDIDVGLTDTFRRSFLSNIRTDKVQEASAAIYADSTLHWTDWLRTTVGWRGDAYAANVDSIYDGPFDPVAPARTARRGVARVAAEDQLGRLVEDEQGERQ